MKEVASGRRTGRGEVQETGEGLPITATVGSSRYAGDFEADETAQALVRDVTAVSVGAVTRDGDEQVCPVTFRVTMESPKEIGVYRLLLSASVQCPADLFPTDLEPWVDEWDVSVADELTWTSDPGTFDGSQDAVLKAHHEPDRGFFQYPQDHGRQRALPPAMNWASSMSISMRISRDISATSK